MSGPSDPDAPPADIEAVASERAEARAVRDFARADELKARLEAAGWTVVDDGSRYTLARARPPDRHEGGRVLHGSADSVLSRLDTPERDGSSAIVVGGPDPDEVVATVHGLVASTGPDVDVTVVAADGSLDRTTLLDGLRGATGAAPIEVGGVDTRGSASRVEVVWTVDGMSVGESLEAGLRRATGRIVLVLEAGAVPEGDPVAPIDEALRDGSVAVVGSEALVSADLHRFEPAGPDRPVTALGPTVIGFRRLDAPRVADIDVRLGGYAGVIAWASLALREAGDGGTVRQALRLDLPVRPRTGSREDEEERGGLIARRDRYRLGARFGGDSGLAG